MTELTVDDVSTMRELTVDEVSRVNGGLSEFAIFALEFTMTVGVGALFIPAAVPIMAGLAGLSLAFITGYAIGLGINYMMGWS